MLTCKKKYAILTATHFSWKTVMWTSWLIQWKGSYYCFANLNKLHSTVQVDTSENKGDVFGNQLETWLIFLTI